ncbi:S8 family serine peptidase, partial [Lyngbya sp. CCY1209]|uniref:S8 family serine peptidase n=1 Tax=Lyngbya sp. CCY1209 TaxID=2886103 RepID=UPI002D2169C9
AGTIAAQGDNGVGVTGVSWDAQIMAVKFLNDSGSGTIFNAIQAVEYATMMGADLTNNSWGGYFSSSALQDAIDAAGASGQVFVAAAGNYDSDNDVYPFNPASYDSENIISVAATDHNDELASFSHYGATSVDLAAPGVDIFSSVPGDGYASYDGTSMAAPHVAGVASLLLSQDPSLSPGEVKQSILDTVDEIPALDGLMVTGGRLNANTAVSPDEPGSISGQKWNDLDTDGDKDDDEPGLADWTIYIDENNNGQLDPEEPSTVTDGDGNYTFDNLEPGTYEVAEELQDGWQQTYPGSLKNTGFETGDLTGWETRGDTSVKTDAFGSDPTEGTYQALVTNGDGSQSDADLEAFLNLPGGILDGLGNGDATEGSAIKQTLTVKAGDEISFDYNFLTNEGSESPFNDFAFVSVESDGDTVANTFTPLVPSGTSFWSETGWGTYTHTFTADGTYNIGVGAVDVGDTAIDSGVLLDNFSFTGTAPGSHTVDVGEGEDVLDIDFGNVESESGGSISGVKWNDLNADGVKDEGEPALSDWTIYIDENNNSQLDPEEPSAVTNSDGEYTFTGLFEGTYTIREEQQEGWKQSYPTGGEGSGTSEGESIEMAREQVSGDLASESDRRSEIPRDAEYARNQVIVKFKSGADSGDRNDILNTLGAEVVETTQNSGVQLWQIEGDVENAVATFNEHPAIEYIEPNYIVNINSTIPNDPEFSQLWGLDNTGQTGGTPDADIDAPEAWDVQTGN